MFFVNLTGFLIGLILLLMLIVCVTIFVVALWKEYQGEYFSVKDLIDDTGKVLKKFLGSVQQFLKKSKKKNRDSGRKTWKQSTESSKSRALPESRSGQDWTKVYQHRQLMSREEALQFRKVQRWAAKRNYLVFAKVRLSDLVESKVDPQVSKKPALIIQSKCVDFVVCDPSMEVKCTIVLSGSQKSAKRMEVSRFVSEVLTACGYKVLMTDTVNERDLDNI